jgi:ComF family protein
MHFLDIFFAKQCPGCFEIQDNNNFCSACFSRLSFIINACKMCQEQFDVVVPGVDVCLKCADRNFSHSKMRCVFKYNEFVKQLILRFKNQSDFSLGKVLGRFLINALADFGCEIVIPVPLFKNRLVWRGFNQSVFLARLIAKGSNIMFMHALERVRNTNSQALKKIEERFANVDNAFLVSDSCLSLIKGRKILLVDDVITTGATVFECAKVLMKSGAGDVKIGALARRMKSI